MHKVILVCMMSIAISDVIGQGLLKVQSPTGDTMPVKTLRLSASEIKKYQLSAKKWDSIKKNTPTTSSIITENNATDANIPPVVLPSPNSSSLLNLISDNVDLYTGKTNVNLPLYTLKCGNITLSIGLQSNVNAHKVNDIGSG